MATDRYIKTVLTIIADRNTNTTAGQVQGESFIYVDNETGLPLRIEGFSQATGKSASSQ